MSNFVQNPFGVVDFHEQQANHYLRPNQEQNESMRGSLRPHGEGPPPPPKDRSHSPGAAIAARAAAEHQGEFAPQDSPFPRIGTDRPRREGIKVTRKPVPRQGIPDVPPPDPIPKPTEIRTDIDGNTTKVIYRGPDGRFDPSTIRTEDAKRFSNPNTPVHAPTNPFALPGNTAVKDFADVARTDAARPTLQTRDSGSSFGVWKKKGTDDGASNRPGSRRSSITDVIVKGARRLSDAAKHAAHIIGLGELDREAYKGQKVVEAYELRQAEQAKKHDSANPAPCAPTQKNSPLPPLPGEIAEAQGKKDSVFTTGEKVAIGLSSLTDTFKPRARANTNDSDMSFADASPPEGSMENCVTCQYPTPQFLHSDGRCDACHKHEREQRILFGRLGKVPAELKPPARAPTGTDDVSGESDPGSPYIRLARLKKMVKVRQTVYDDPGNPFAESDEVNDSVPMASVDARISKRSAAGGDELLAGSVFEDAVESPESPESNWSPSVAIGNQLHAPIPRRVGKPTVIRNARHSISVAIIEDDLSVANLDDIYVAPRSQWRRISDSSRKQENRQEVRNTKFYNFYDDILGDDKRKSRV